MRHGRRHHVAAHEVLPGTHDPRSGNETNEPGQQTHAGERVGRFGSRHLSDRHARRYGDQGRGERSGGAAQGEAAAALEHVEVGGRWCLARRPSRLPAGQAAGV